MESCGVQMQWFKCYIIFSLTQLTKWRGNLIFSDILGVTESIFQLGCHGSQGTIYYSRYIFSLDILSQTFQRGRILPGAFAASDDGKVYK